MKHTFEVLSSNYESSVIDNGEEMKFNMFFENEVGLISFQSISRWCFQNKLNIKEFTKGERTYGGKKMTYAEIQMMKNKK